MHNKEMTINTTLTSEIMQDVWKAGGFIRNDSPKAFTIIANTDQIKAVQAACGVNKDGATKDEGGNKSNGA